MLPPFRIHNQSKPDECVPCAAIAIGEKILGRPIDPLFTYMKSKDDQFGLEPVKVCQSVINDGFQLEAGGEPVKIFKEYKRVITIPFFFNIFAGIKRVLLNKKKEVLAGCYWQPEWNKIGNGIVDGMYQNLELFPHAFKVCDVVEKNGIIYLVIQNSQGKDVGDNGLFYFPESIAKNFRFAYYFN